jgi:hypothetical protein
VSILIVRRLHFPANRNIKYLSFLLHNRDFIMMKLEQVLVIEPPNELTFVGPFTSPVSSLMTLRNPTDRKVCFKIKTTAPKRYCVKPNSGVIDPKQTVQVQVSLQPFEYDPNDKNRHKFMVQSMFAPDGEINQDTLWKESTGNRMMDSKLRCVFVIEDGHSDGGNVETGNEYSTAKTDLPIKASTLSSSPKVSSGDDSNLRKSVEEIKKLQEEISALRQENIQLKEEALRQKRLAAAASSRPEISSSSVMSSGEALTVGTISPDQSALSVAYLYAALAILVMGIIVGKWFL